MKTFKYIFILAMACSLTTSCMDKDWNAPTITPEAAGVGNASLKETHVISIADFKERYKDYINTDPRDGVSFTKITDDIQLKAVVTGNDIQGNLYNEVSVEDETGAIIIAINKGGLYGILPEGSEILVNLKDLYIGNYGRQAIIGTPFTSNRGQTYVSRMNFILWQQHFKPTGQYRVVEPAIYNSNWTAATDGLQYGGKLVTLKNVSFQGANGKATYADPQAGQGSKSVFFNEYNSRNIMLYTSNFADFADNALPTGKVDVTGIMKRFNNTWEIIIRKLDDVKEVK